MYLQVVELVDVGFVIMGENRLYLTSDDTFVRELSGAAIYGSLDEACEARKKSAPF